MEKILIKGLTLAVSLSIFTASGFSTYTKAYSRLEKVNNNTNYTQLTTKDVQKNQKLSTTPILLSKQNGIDNNVYDDCEKEGSITTNEKITKTDPKNSKDEGIYVSRFYNSNPVNTDSDYDGIEDSVDQDPNNNEFEGKYTSDGFTWEMSYKLDYSNFFNDNTKYNKNLSKLGALLSGSAAKGNIMNVTSGASFKGDMRTVLTNFGLSNIENYHIANSAKWLANPDDDTAEVWIAHRNVVYQGKEKEVIFVSLRGSDFSAQEWYSNLDIGANTKDYWDRNNPEWKNKLNHKGVDVASNRIYDYIMSYVKKNTKYSNTKAIFINGFSRGASIANILGTKFEEDRRFDSYTYTYACMNVTTDKNAGRYKTIFNIMNEDDMVPNLPLKEWGFRKYGKTFSASIKSDYTKYPWTSKEGTTWKEKFGKNYNDNENLEPLLNEFKKIVKCREDIYKFTNDKDTFYTYTNRNYKNAEKEIAKRLEKYGPRFKNTVRVTAVPRGNAFDIKVQQSPAFLLSLVHDVVAKTEYVPAGNKYKEVKYVQRGKGEDKLFIVDVSFYVAKKYKLAKEKVVWSGADSNPFAAALKFGGIVHPHQTGTYYLIAEDSKKALA